MWIMEQPLPIVFLGLIAVIGLIGGLVQTGRAALLYAAIVAALLTVALLVTERLVVTPREQVKATLHVIANDIETNDIRAIVQHIAEGKPDLRQDAEKYLRLATIHDVSIKRNLKINVVEERGIAEAKFNAVIRFSDKTGMLDRQVYPRFFSVVFGLEPDGQWRVRSYTMEDPREGLNGQ